MRIHYMDGRNSMHIKPSRSEVAKSVQRADETNEAINIIYISSNDRVFLVNQTKFVQDLST